MEHIFTYINPLKLIVLATFIFAWTTLDRSIKEHRFLLAILGLCLATELINSVLILLGRPFYAVLSVSSIVHIILWLTLLRKIGDLKTITVLAIGVFITFGVINFFLFEGMHFFNYMTFVVGALLYIVLFIVESFRQLSLENFNFFNSNSYLLVLSPLIFFFGLSIMFGFRSYDLTSTRIFGGFKLWDCAIYFVNIFYYSLVNIYIYREKRKLCSIKLPTEL